MCINYPATKIPKDGPDTHTHTQKTTVGISLARKCFKVSFEISLLEV